MKYNWDKLRRKFFEDCVSVIMIPGKISKNIRLTPEEMFLWIKDTFTEKFRTPTQNRALHLYFKMISDQMNNAGHTRERLFCNRIIEMPYDEYHIKDTWKFAQWDMFKIKSTTKINTIQINTLIDVMSLHFGQQGIYVEFPNWQSFMNKLDAKTY